MKLANSLRHLQQSGLLVLLVLFGCHGQEKSDAYGQFEATETTISAEVSGKLLNFGVEEGDLLEKGQEVGLVDTTKWSLQERELEAQLESIRSQIANINADVEVQKQELELARTNFNRVQAMHEDGAERTRSLRIAGQ